MPCLGVNAAPLFAVVGSQTQLLRALLCERFTRMPRRAMSSLKATATIVAYEDKGEDRGQKRSKLSDGSALVQSGGEQRRRFFRRDTDDQVERVMSAKLYPKFPRECFDSFVAEDGSTPRSTIAEELRRTRGSQYLKAAF